MNGSKLLVLAIVALTASLVAGNSIAKQLEEERSELSLNPDDDAETEHLKGTNLEGFRDFCLRTRDAVISDMRNRGNIFASEVFSGIFKSLGQIAQSSLSANSKATEKLSQQLANPDAEIDENNEGEIDKIIAEGQRAIKEAENQPKGLLRAFLSGVSSLASAGYSEAVAKVNQLKAGLGDTSITENLIAFCEQLTRYEEEALEIFKSTKESLEQEDPEQYKQFTYSDVAPKCVTANRLTRAEGFCRFVLSAKDPLTKVLGFKFSSEQ